MSTTKILNASLLLSVDNTTNRARKGLTIRTVYAKFNAWSTNTKNDQNKNSFGLITLLVQAQNEAYSYNERLAIVASHVRTLRRSLCL